MPLYTPTWMLPYPAPSDPPCDFAETWCDLSDAFQVAIDGFTETIDRTEPAIPMAQLRLTEPYTLISGVPIVFDTLGVDTAGWINFDADPSAIVTDRGGYIGVSANATVQSTGTTPVTFQLYMVSGAPSLIDTQIDQGTANTVYGLQLSGLTLLTSAASFGLTVARTSDDEISLLQAQMTVFWHSDRAAP